MAENEKAAANPTPKIHHFSVVPARIIDGEPTEVVVSWDCTGADAVTLSWYDKDGHEKALSDPVLTAHGMITLKLDQALTVVLTAGPATARLSVQVIAKTAVIEGPLGPGPQEIAPSIPGEPEPEPEAVVIPKNCCPKCHEKPAPFVAPERNSFFQARLDRIKADHFPEDHPVDEKELIEKYLHVQGGYIAHCKCGTDFFVRT